MSIYLTELITLQILEAYEVVFSTSMVSLKSATGSSADSLLAVISEAAVLKAEALNQQINLSSGRNKEAQAQLFGLSDEMLALAKLHGGKFSVIKAAEQISSLAKFAGKELDVIQLEVGDTLGRFPGSKGISN